MVLHIDRQKITNFGKQNSRQITKLIITHSFLELQSSPRATEPIKGTPQATAAVAHEPEDKILNSL